MEMVLRIALRILAFGLLSALLVQPVLAFNGMELAHGPDLALIALGVMGVLLGRRAGYRVGGG
jgi:hypothetical protein